MPIRIFTLPFLEETQTFHDDLVHQFCQNKRIHKIETKFFTRNGQPFWTVAVHYGMILSEEKPSQSGGKTDKEGQLDEQQKVLFLRLREWRKEESESRGFPVYLIATNNQLAEMVLNKCTTLESLKLVKGFGASKIQNYGNAIISKVKTFYQGS